eukprot:1156503-Pelagomonas_calceolata.AAC.14
MEHSSDQAKRFRSTTDHVDKDGPCWMSRHRLAQHYLARIETSNAAGNMKGKDYAGVRHFEANMENQIASA